MPVAAESESFEPPFERPTAERVEYVPLPPDEEAPEEIAEAFAAIPAAGTPTAGAESVPVGEHGDRTEPASAEAAEPSRHHASAELPTHDVTGSSANPKRGWWRRVIDR